MKTTFKNLLLAVVFGLAACTGHVNVQPVSVATPEGLNKISGKHVAMIQKGGWHLETKSTGLKCWTWSFDTAIDESFSAAMRDALSQSLENVAFVDSELSKDDLKSKGYNDQIIIYQGNAVSKFDVNPNLFIGATGLGSVELTTNIAITDATGLAKQYTVVGKASSTDDIYFCGDLEKAVGVAAQGAVKDLAEKSVMLIREGLRDRMDKKAANAKN